MTFVGPRCKNLSSTNHNATPQITRALQTEEARLLLLSSKLTHLISVGDEVEILMGLSSCKPA